MPWRWIRTHHQQEDPMFNQRTITVRSAQDRVDAIAQATAHLAGEGTEVTGVVAVIAPFGSVSPDWQVEVQTKTAGPWTAPAIKWGKLGEK
jgi:hypothetical protein